MAKRSLFNRALNTELHSRFAARAEDLGRPLTDDEVKVEAQYQLEDLPYKGIFEDDRALYRRVERQLKALLK